MSTEVRKADVSAAIREHELATGEAAALRGLVSDGATLEEALAAVLAGREVDGQADADAPAPAPEQSAEPTEKQLGELDAEVTRHLEAVQSIMGHHVAGMEPCENCGGIGLQPAAAPRPHENFKRCATCNGFGEVLTGSKRDGYSSRQCPGCMGRGYLEKMVNGAPVSPDGTPAANEPTDGTAVLAVPMPTPPANGAVVEETYGAPSWMGDPNLGR